MRDTFLTCAMFAVFIFGCISAATWLQNGFVRSYPQEVISNLGILVKRIGSAE